MTRKQFGEVMAYLVAATNQPMSKERADVYFDLLQELPLETLRIAAKKVAIAHVWSTFPSVAELHSAACDAITTQCQERSAAEAWELARAVADKIDPDIGGPYWKNGKQYPTQMAAHLDGVPLLVAKTMREIGWQSIAGDKESVVRAHFIRAYDAAVTEHKKLTLMPASLKREIEQQNKGTLLTQAQQAIGQIGMEK